MRSVSFIFGTRPEAIKLCPVILAMRERSMWQSLSPEMDRFMVGAAIGLVMWHFIVDAGVWKLSNKWFRGQCFERMKFLFDRPGQ